ncbi:hypothetical protein [Frigoriflavimonas asaccharolytica]|uniref:Uncharacterized protein n=1 Tax=Frigoriflavimonas asaccharolytica TaxID=2735899 RepID=A0A8J8GD96_9FLAO|nr:hypothetical protein [Frigoriflavimonas asaccharolytica]NRS93652.1 hypothetical protein [Frigoriflavimonas asaccharolytica]
MNFRTYFQQYQNNFWEWENDDSIEDQFFTTFNMINIPNVGPISYIAYALEILKTLSDNGLPPFGSFLLVLYAASREDFRKIDGLIYFIKSKCEKFNKIGNFPIEHENAILFLENINNLGKNLKKGQNKILLFNTIFKDAHYKLSSSDSKNIIENIHANFSAFDLSFKNNFSKDVFSRDLKVLNLLHEKFPTEKAISNAMFGYTEIEEIEEEIVEEENSTDNEIDEDLLENLIKEPETFHIGSLIKRLWSGMKIPMHQYSPGNHPLGGIADITNKGSFDRMLLSEFANDDDVFVSRVANNEVLFIEREIPPEENIYERILIIDASIKNWGTPKTLAFSTAIAIAKHPKANTDYKIFVAANEMKEVSLNTVEDVIEGATKISAQLHSTNVLNDFLENLAIKKGAEVFLLLSEDALKSAEMQRLIQEHRNILSFVISSNSEGIINFHKYTKGTRKHIQKVMLPLEELWKQKREKKANKENKTGLPLIYPLLFPVKSDFIAEFLIDDYQYILTKSKSLIRRFINEMYNYDYDRDIKGAEVLFEKISIKNRGNFGFGIHTNGDHYLIQYLYEQRKIYILNLTLNQFYETNIPKDFDAGSTLTPVFYENKFYIYYSPKNEGLEIFILEDKAQIISVETNNKDVNEIFDYINNSDYIITNYQNILSNINSISVNISKNLLIGKHELSLQNYFYLDKINDSNSLKNSVREGNTFTFSEESNIVLDKRGILIFESHNPEIPKFYITSIVNGYLGVASETEIAGNPYYYPKENTLEVIDNSEFIIKYFLPFIQNIIDYGTED